MAENENNKTPISLNTFYKGMNKDMSKYILPNDQYYDANNVRIVSDIGKEGAAMVNIQGNDHLIDIPCSPSVYELLLDQAVNLAGVAWTSNVTIAVQDIAMGTVINWTITLTGTGGNPVQALATALAEPAGLWQMNGVVSTNGPSNLPDGNPGFYWSYDASSKKLLFWGKPISPDFTQFPSLGTLGQWDFTINQVQSVTITGGFFSQQVLAFPHCNLTVIGYADLRDTIYLFTTNFDGGTPDADGGPGQIWKLTVDPSIQSIHGWRSYIECIYTREQCINFSKQHPIEALGRYEKVDIQGVYWTDFFNPPRKLNVASPDAMNTPCEFLDLAPKTGFQIPILESIVPGGQLKAGVYQLAYRYKSSEGLVTDWSPLSNLVPIYNSRDQNPFCRITGDEYDMTSGENPQTGKRIRWQLFNVDITFELIELAAIYHKDNIPGNVDIYSFAELTNGLQNVIVEHTGSEDKIPISLQEFTQGIGATFEKVKTLDSKDNKLFFGNIVNTTFNVEYDARAYRFDSGQIAILESLSDLPVTVNGAAPYTPGVGQTAIDLVPITHDCINDYNDENPATNPNWFTSDQYKYQLDGLTLGGTGHNISYRFIVEQDEGDHINDTVNPIQTGHFFSDANCVGYNPSPSQACFVNPTTYNAGSVSLGVPSQIYNLNNTYDNYKSPFKWSLYGGYARGETYRFGIVFYNNKGQASFVNWIGDIKIPFNYDSGAGNPFGSFAVSSWTVSPAGGPTFSWLGTTYDQHGTVWLNNIGIEFTVNLDPLTSGIDVNALGITGFSIVRCERTNDDKSKFGTALVNTVDRLEMMASEWDNMNPTWPNLWGVENDSDVLIPTVGIWDQDCGVAGLAYCDGATDNVCDLAPWDSMGYQSGTRICKTRKKEVLLYGPLGWVNSNDTNTGNLQKGLDVDNLMRDGDYIRLSQIYFPSFNSSMGLNNEMWFCGTWRIYSNHWYKYYMGMTVAGGIPGSIASAANYNYTNGIPSNVFAQNPANNTLTVKWGRWVGDGGFIDVSEDNSLSHSFMNVTNPGSQMDLFDLTTPGCPNSQYTGPFSNWPIVRPRSIGSECYFVKLDDTTVPEPWIAAHWLMGASIAGPAATAHVPHRATFSYEKYNTPYGGVTYSNRANSTYMSTGNYYPILPTTNLNVPLTCDVFGGDVQCQIHDFTQYEKNWGQTGFDNFDSLDAAGHTDVLSDAAWGLQRNCVVPLEIHMTNTLWRHGYHFASKQDGGYPNNGTQLHDSYTLNMAYNAQNNVRSYFPAPFNVSLGEEYDTRIYYSETKINGEATDSWAVFFLNNYKDVEGVYGPINRLSRLHDTMYYFQDSGFGALSVNPTAVVQASDGTALQLGTVSTGAGAFIQNYKYISTIYGAKQQWAVTNSDSALYFFDINQHKLFSYSGEGTQPLSDIGGLHSYFTKELRGNILVKDNPILKEGVTCTYDSLNNEILYTFHDKSYVDRYESKIITTSEIGTTPNRVLTLTIRPNNPECNPCFTANCDDYYLSGLVPNQHWTVVTNIQLNGIGPFAGIFLGRIGCPGWTVPNPNPNGVQIGDIIIFIPEVWNGPSITPMNPSLEPYTYDDINISALQVISTECGIGERSITVAYNEMTKGFTSFYDFHPSIYINSGSYFITPNDQHPCLTGDTDFKGNQLYLHGVGIYGEFYDLIYQSSVTLISNMESSLTKTFDNISFHMESIWYPFPQTDADANTTGRNITTNTPEIDISNNTFNTVRFYTDYQMSDYITLVPGPESIGGNIRKKEREWQMAVPRNIMNETLTNADIFNAFNYNPNRQFKDRMRDKYLFIDLIYNNYDDSAGKPLNIKFILHYFKTFFRPSFR